MSRIIAALYDSRAEADFARGRLVSRVKAKSPRIIAKDTIGALDGVDIASEERDAYREKLRLGGHLLLAEVPRGASAEQVIALLEEAIGHSDPRAEQQWGDAEKGVRVELPAEGDGDTPLEPGPTEPGQSQQRPGDERDHSAQTADRSPADAWSFQQDVREAKSERPAGARVRAVTRDVPVEEQVTLIDEVISVENRSSGRSLSDREVDAGGLFQERVFEIAAMREVPVVTKVAVVREEVIVRKTVKARTDTIRETVRQTGVEVEDVNEPDGLFFGQGGNPRNRR